VVSAKVNRFLGDPAFPRLSIVLREHAVNSLIISTYPEIAVSTTKEAHTRPMSTLPDPNSGELTPQSRKSRILRRLPGACMRCRQRKIRCDASISGPLCTNCRLDGRNSCIRPNATQPTGMRASVTIGHSSSETLGSIDDGDSALAGCRRCR
jgi:hypothetical protein